LVATYESVVVEDDFHLELFFFIQADVAVTLDL